MILIAKVGHTEQRVVEATSDIPEGWVTIVEPRPSTKHVLNEDLTWSKRSMTDEEVQNLRASRYKGRVDPLVNEAKLKGLMGKPEEEAALLQQAVAVRLDIQAELPYGKVID